MTDGYTGKILSVNLSNRSVHILDTERYEEYGGGNGIGSAIFWERCQDKAISGFDPRNIVTVMTGPLTGTLTPGTGRTEICGINVFSYPVEWFSRSNIGGFFSAMLKYAGWDGVVIEGRADHPVWINILNDKVTIEDAAGIWGLDIIATQEEIWRRVTGRSSFGEWLSLGNSQSTQGPSILCIGRGGESLSRMGTIQTGIGMAAGQGGFGGVWGSKNLKAISVLGTGSIRISNPTALICARQWLNMIRGKRPAKIDARPSSCSGCFQQCKSRTKDGIKNDGQCLDTNYTTDISPSGKSGSDIIQTYGINLNDTTSVAYTDGMYIKKLYDAGVLGTGKSIDSSPLPMEKFGSVEFAEILCHAIVTREGIGKDLAEGLMRASQKWGRLDQDLKTGLLHKAHWGYGWHWSLPMVEQAYGSLMGDREITEHAFTSQHRVHVLMMNSEFNKLPVDNLIEMISRKLIPYDGDSFMLDYNWQESDNSKMHQALTTGIYSRHKAKFVAWHRHYTRFWSESILYCDWTWPIWFNRTAPDFEGLTPEAETRLFNAVTGKNLSFEKSMEIGRKIWNLNRAIWVLQGRHRNLERFAEFMHTPSGSHAQTITPFRDGMYKHLPIYENGQWRMANLENMYLDKNGVEQWKTHFYEVEGWDRDNGWPTRKTLQELGLNQIADSLEKAGKLGIPK